MVLATTAGKARFSSPELCGMRISKLRQSVFSVTDMMRATWVCIWRRSKLKLSPTGCQAAVSSRQMISTTLARIDSSMSVSSRKRPVSSLAAEQEIDDRRRQGQIQLQHRKRSQRLQAHRGDIADLGNAQQKLVERNLFGRDQVDLKAGAQPGGQVVRQVAREQVVQHADGAQLLGRDLARRGEVVGHHASLRVGLLRLGRRAARRLKEGVDLILLERLFHVPCSLSTDHYATVH